MDKIEKVDKTISKQEQMSDTLVLNLILAFSGGFQDAYTYVVRGKVFANAQTGNLVLMSTYFMEGQWHKSLLYLFPIFSFLLGVFVSNCVEYRFKYAKVIHWRQCIVLGEVFIMIVVGFLPQSFNMLANCMISFACALQLQSFKKAHGNVYASTMCIGNMKSLVCAFSDLLRSRAYKDKVRVHDYLTVILLFTFGAGIGGNCSKVYNEVTIWGSAVLLLICVGLMALDTKK